MTREVETYLPLEELRPEDRKLFDKNISALNQELPIIRERAKSEYDEVPKRVAGEANILIEQLRIESRYRETILQKLRALIDIMSFQKQTSEGPDSSRHDLSTQPHLLGDPEISMGSAK